MRYLFLLLACNSSPPPVPIIQTPPILPIIIPKLDTIDLCTKVAKVVVTLDSSIMTVGSTTQAHATVYDSLGLVIKGCTVIWSVLPNE